MVNRKYVYVSFYSVTDPVYMLLLFHKSIVCIADNAICILTLGTIQTSFYIYALEACVQHLHRKMKK